MIDNKAQSEVVGHVILLSITIIGIAMITLYGIPVIYNLQDIAHLRSAEQGFTVFDSRASKTALGETPRQITDINLGGGTISVVPNSSSQLSYIIVELKNETTTLYNITIPMGKVVYKLNDREVAYEGGGVWSKYASGSVMISSPEFHYNGVTLTLPVMNISGSSSIGGKGKVSLNIRSTGTEILYPLATLQNPIPENVTKVNLTVKSEYYDAWANYFESIPLTKVYSNKDEKKVIVTLETPPVVTNFSYGALASDEIDLKNTAEIDSYNSTIGNYSISRSGNGSIRANNKITIVNKAVVNGSALSGGSINCGNGNNCGTIKRDAYGEIDAKINVEGTRYPAVERITLRSTTSLVHGKINAYKTNNNNNDTSAGGCLSGEGNRTLDGTWTNCTISTGNYYLTEFELKNKNLIFDTANGSVNIAVDADIEINKANITISGANPVKIYLNGGMTVKTSGAINRNTDDKSSLFQVFSSSNEEIKFRNNIEFCGFVYAPSADIIVGQSAEIFGALVGKKFEVDNSQNIHFDEALQNLDTGISSGITIMYLHITRNDIKVSIS